MYTLPLSTVAQWHNFQGHWMPQSVDTLCPFCGRLVNLPLQNSVYDPGRQTVSANAKCPGCSKISWFWIVEPGDAKDSSKRGCVELCIHPNPRPTRKPIVTPEKMHNEVLGRAYQSTLKAYNLGEWVACATLVRRTLEGLVKSLLPKEEDTKSLYQQLQALPKHVDLEKPILTLADNIRKGGNIAAHFDLEKEPDQKTAEMMVDLLDYFLEYVYVLTERAADLEKQLESLGKDQ